MYLKLYRTKQEKEVIIEYINSLDSLKEPIRIYDILNIIDIHGAKHLVDFENLVTKKLEKS